MENEILVIGIIKPVNHEEDDMMHERQQLLDLLEQNSIPYDKVEHPWPRDLFVSFNGKILEEKEHYRYADGGFVIVRPEFTLICDEVSKKAIISGRDKPEKRYEKLINLYGPNFHILPAPNVKLNEAMPPHIDLVILPIPERGVLFADRRYTMDNRRTITNLCNKLNLNLELVDHDYKNPSWPCNSVIINNDGRLFAITNSDKNEHFISRLNSYGITSLATPYSANCQQGGGIFCSTNTCPRDKFSQVEKLCRDYNVILV